MQRSKFIVLCWRSIRHFKEGSLFLTYKENRQASLRAELS